MHLCFVLSEISARATLSPGPFDLDRLLTLALEHEIEVFVDQVTEASEQLRQHEVSVTASLRRRVWNEVHRSHDSPDVIQARAVARRHADTRFDAIIYGSDLTIDFAWYEPSLREIPRGVALGAGIPHDVSAIWEDRGLFALHGRRVFSQTGLISSADFLVGCPGSLDRLVRDATDLPPLLATRASQPIVGEICTRVELEHGLVVVVATAAGAYELTELIVKVVQRVPVGPGIVYAVIVRHLEGAHSSPAQAVLAAVTRQLRDQVIVVAADEDGVASEWLNQADVLVASSAAELAVEAVAEAIGSKQALILGASGATTAGSFPDDVRQSRARASCAVLRWEQSGPDRRRQLGRLDLSASDAVVLVYEPGRAGPAARLALTPDIERVDFVIWARSTGLYGQPDPRALYPFALGVRAELLPLLAEAFGEASSLWDLIQWVVQLGWSNRCRILLMNGGEGDTFLEPREDHSLVRPMPCTSGLLPAPHALPQVGGEPPNQLAPRPDTSLDLLRWAQRSHWSQRLRLALPWRWGLLERGMRSRW